ncbi:hypothetical protein Bhyg_03048, partial [Pseudolycoriella hygida]
DTISTEASKSIKFIQQVAPHKSPQADISKADIQSSNNVTEKSFACDVCGKSFPTKRRMKIHRIDMPMKRISPLHNKSSLVCDEATQSNPKEKEAPNRVIPKQKSLALCNSELEAVSAILGALRRYELLLDTVSEKVASDSEANTIAYIEMNELSVTEVQRATNQMETGDLIAEELLCGFDFVETSISINEENQILFSGDVMEEQTSNHTEQQAVGIANDNCSKMPLTNSFNNIVHFVDEFELNTTRDNTSFFWSIHK